jgi:hypothetical protein
MALVDLRRVRHILLAALALAGLAASLEKIETVGRP